MRSPRRSADEQYNLVMECRSSGLSDQQWCLQHDINPGTFYNWVKRLRAKKHYDIPAATRQAGLTAAVKQDVVKVEILQDHSGQVHEISEPSHVEDTECILPQPETAPIEIHLNKAVLRITNDIDPRLLSQILRSIGGCVCYKAPVTDTQKHRRVRMLGDISVVTELYVVCGYTDYPRSIVIREELLLSTINTDIFVNLLK